MGKSTISMAIFNCYVSSLEGIPLLEEPPNFQPLGHVNTPRWTVPVDPPVQGRRGFAVALEGREKVRAVLGRLGRLSGSVELSSK